MPVTGPRAAAATPAYAVLMSTGPQPTEPAHSGRDEQGSPVDWEAASRRAGRLVRPGPPIDRVGLDHLVSSLREAAADAPLYVGETTGLIEAAETVESGQVYVLDRPRWAEATIGAFRALGGDQLPASGMPGGARIAGEQLGVMLAFLASRVLGQFDPYAGPQGRLLLIAPNVLHVQRELDVAARDFHLWVCLHEQTHAVQFAAAPWLAGHLASTVTGLVDSLAQDQDPARRFGDVIAAVRSTLGPGRAEPASAMGGGALLEAVLDPEEQAAMAEAIAVMALLEGHADVVMDAVGPTVIPAVATIRSRFERRRDGRGTVDRLLRRMLGMDAKIAQYREGAEFVRGVVRRVGHEGLNAVWSGPDLLPSAAEISDPSAWVARVHG